MDGMLIPLLTTLGYSLPELLGCGAALAMVWSGAQAGRPRRLALTGLGVMLACVLLQLGIGLYQNWTIQSNNGAMELRSMFMALGVVRVLVNCCFVGGIVTLAWALCLATRAQRGSPPPL